MFISKFIQTGVHNVDPMQNLYINVKNYFGIINDVIIIGIFFRNKDYEKIVEAINICIYMDLFIIKYIIIE